MRFDMRGAMVTFALLILFVYPSVSALDPAPIQSGGFEYTLETMAEPEDPWIDWYLNMVEGQATWISARYDTTWQGEFKVKMMDIDTGMVTMQWFEGNIQTPVVMGNQLFFRQDYSHLMSWNLTTEETTVLFDNLSRMGYADDRIVAIVHDQEGLQLMVHYPGNGTTRRMGRVYSTGDVAITDRWVGFTDSVMPSRGIEFIHLENGTRINVEGGKHETNGLSLDGDRACWVEGDYSNYHIVFMDLITRERRTVFSSSGYLQNAIISGDLIVWSDQWPGIGTYSNVFVHHIPSGRTMEVELNYTEEFSPAIEGNRIVFMSGRDYRYSVRMMTVLSVPEVERKDHGSRMDPDDILGAAIMTFLALTVILVILLLLPERGRGHTSSTRSRQGRPAKGPRAVRSGSIPPYPHQDPAPRSSR